jgi:hypothetical protein
MPATAAKYNGLKLILSPIIRATTKIVAASKTKIFAIDVAVVIPHDSLGFQFSASC